MSAVFSIVNAGVLVVEPLYLFVCCILMFVATPFVTFCQKTEVWAGFAEIVHGIVTDTPISTLYCGCGMVTVG